jgi:ribosome recycling factor
MKNEIEFQEGEVRGFEFLLKEQMIYPMKHFEKELASIRTGRASTALIQDVMVECYGGKTMPLKELATLGAPDARLVTVQPWDKSLIGEIEKAILASDVGITPVNDGNIIRLQLPQMSTERRSEIIKILGKKTEECKVGVRNVRKDFHNEVRDAVKKKIISEDFAKKLNDLLQRVTDEFITKTDKTAEKKGCDIRMV